MKRFVEIFKKVNGKEVLKQYWHAHVLFFALLETLLLGFSHKDLEIVRLAVSERIYKKLKKKNASFIEKFKIDFSNQQIEKRHADIIWMSWLQGLEQAPPIVQECFSSVQSKIKNKKIIIITEDNYSQYVEFPDHIVEKYNQGVISKTHFSDLLRLELLTKYGGTWLDGTVYCSRPIKEENYILEADLFLFQNLKPGLDGQSTCISSWLMTASTGNPIILLTRALLLHYWENYNYFIDYFLIHDFFQMAIEAYPDVWDRVVPYSNSTPHILLLRLFDQYDRDVWKAVDEQCCFHKLTYKFPKEYLDKRGTYYDIVVAGRGE